MFSNPTKAQGETIAIKQIELKALFLGIKAGAKEKPAPPRLTITRTKQTVIASVNARAKNKTIFAAARLLNEHKSPVRTIASAVSNTFPRKTS